LSKNIKIIFVILTVILIAFIILIFRFYFSVNIASKKDDSEFSIANELNDDFYSFKNDNGLYGVKDSQGHIVIQAQWKKIIQLNNDRFIVSKTASGKVRCGIIDLNENVMVPFIYSKIFSQMDEYLVGKVDNGDNPEGYVLFDMNGDTIIEEEWDSCLKKFDDKSISTSENYIQVQKGNNVYRIHNIDDRGMQMFYIKLQKSIFGKKIKIEINDNNPVVNLNSAHVMYNELADNTIKYISALFENNAENIKDLYVYDDYKNILLEDMAFRGSELGYISDIKPSITEENGIVKYMCNVILRYTSPESISWDGTVTPVNNAASVNIIMTKNANGNLRIERVEAEKKDISELNVPDDYVKPETTQSSEYTDNMEYPDIQNTILYNESTSEN